jgi:hypothetical protein
MAVAPDIYAMALANEARGQLDRTIAEILDARRTAAAPMAAIHGFNGYLRWRNLWRAHDRMLARIPGPLAEC